jgi:hypothetical protein
MPSPAISPIRVKTVAIIHGFLPNVMLPPSIYELIVPLGNLSIDRIDKNY